MKEKVERFIEIIENYGEIFFSTGDYKKDYEYMKNIIASQGYYSGCKYRFYFDKDLNFLSIESRF